MTQSDTKPGCLPASLLHAYVTPFFEHKDRYLEAAQRWGSPLYILEPQVLKARAKKFISAFSTVLENPGFYFAMKSNNLPEVSGILIQQGFGLDVSSGIELAAALNLGAGDIIFSGPGKTTNELALAVRHHDRITLLLDSFSEFKRLGRMLDAADHPVRVGIRVNNNPEGLWRKFGILPEEIPDLWQQIEQHPKARFCGLQFHSSWNLTPERQTAFIRRLGDILERAPHGLAASVEFLDIGGGYWPEAGEWQVTPDPLLHLIDPAQDIDTFARQIAQALEEKIIPLTNARICFEPGRWICSDAMHILIQVIDKKAPDLIITDAGTNAVGWERFETDYFPVLNLSKSSLTESPCRILGSLCTPHDVWGYAYFGSGIEEGDFLMIPGQGAYTYSLRQHFIKELPTVAQVK
jgi:diaminopimelate decarboxylase